MKRRICELCNEGEAYLYCASDSAFLCWKCDVRVHDANFLVARHIREILCCDCKNLSGRQVSGRSVAPFEKKSCRNCSPENPPDEEEEDCLSSSSMSSSACVSTTESSATGPKKLPSRTESSSASVTENFKSEALGCYKKRRRNREKAVRCVAEEVFVNWGRRLGVNGNRVVLMAAAAPAMEKLMAVVPYRVAAATAFWFGLRNCDGGDGEGRLRTAENLRRLEEMTRVPRKVIVAAEEKLTRVLRPKRARRELEEGWAEC